MGDWFYFNALPTMRPGAMWAGTVGTGNVITENPLSRRKSKKRLCVRSHSGLQAFRRVLAQAPTLTEAHIAALPDDVAALALADATQRLWEKSNLEETPYPLSPRIDTVRAILLDRREELCPWELERHIRWCQDMQASLQQGELNHRLDTETLFVATLALEASLACASLVSTPPDRHSSCCAALASVHSRWRHFCTYALIRAGDSYLRESLRSSETFAHKVRHLFGMEKPSPSYRSNKHEPDWTQWTHGGATCSSSPIVPLSALRNYITFAPALEKGKRSFSDHLGHVTQSPLFALDWAALVVARLDQKMQGLQQLTSLLQQRHACLLELPALVEDWEESLFA